MMASMISGDGWGLSFPDIFLTVEKKPQENWQIIIIIIIITINIIIIITIIITLLLLLLLLPLLLLLLVYRFAK